MIKLLVFSGRHRRLHQLDLNRPVALSLAAFGLVGLIGAVFYGGVQAGKSLAFGSPQAQLLSWEHTLAEQAQELERVREDSRQTLDALAQRMSRMNAQVIRLDALGGRLTQMADLDDGEFDFSRSPGLGGPDDHLPGSASHEVADVARMMDELDAQIASQTTQLNVLEGLLMHRGLRDRVQPAGRPVNTGWMSSSYGRRTDPFTGRPAYHRGVDFAGRTGNDIVAVADGVVVFSGSRYGYGRMVDINHGNGYVTRYAHNSENLVEVGDTVSKGQLIALMGATGRATAPHLHFEVLRDGQQVNPQNYIRAAR